MLATVAKTANDSFFPILFALLVISGCASSHKSAGLARDAFAAGDLQTAVETLDELASEKSRLSDAAALDLAMVELATGKPKAAEHRLRELRDRFDGLPRIAPLQEAASIVTDDTMRTYRPAGYEEVMVRAMLAVCSLADDASDAESYAMQATMKQNDLVSSADQRGLLAIDDKLKPDMQPIALTPYLRGVLREATHHDYDDAARAYKLVSDLRPQFKPAPFDLARVTNGRHSAPGNGVLYVIACVGRGPMLEECVAETTSSSLTIASQILRGDKDDEVPLPNIATVKVPRVVLPPSNIAAISAQFAGHPLGTTQTITDVAELATNQIAMEMPWTIARAIVRRVTKEATVASVGNSLGLEGSAASIFQFAAGSFWSSTEKADTRCWGMLPREIQVLRAELPAGDQTVEFSPIGFQGQPIAPKTEIPVTIVDGRNQYLVVVAPHARMHFVK